MVMSAAAAAAAVLSAPGGVAEEGQKMTILEEVIERGGRGVKGWLLDEIPTHYADSHFGLSL